MKPGIIYVGALGFPFGSAAVNRRIQITSILQKSNFKVFVVLRRGEHDKHVAITNDIKVCGHLEKVRYFHCSLLAYRPKSFLIRNLLKILGVVNEFILLVVLRIQGYKHLLSDTMYLSSLRYYSFLSKLLKMTLTYDYVEYVDSIKFNEVKIIEQIPGKFDTDFIRYVDQVIVVSKFLQSKVFEQNQNISTYYLPPTLDITEITPATFIDLPDSYIAYCGVARYKRPIQFIIDSFNKSDFKKYHMKLLLILNGNEAEINPIINEINSKGLKDDAIVKSKLKYNELLWYYKNSLALLLPLNNTIKDQARFPFKLCEYTVAGKPIITNNIGVVNEIFAHHVNAIISPFDDMNRYTSYLNYIYTHREEAEIIGKNAYSIFKQHFSSDKYKLDQMFRL